MPRYSCVIHNTGPTAHQIITNPRNGSNRRLCSGPLPLDYCNSLYFGMSDINFAKLQRVHNSLARIVTSTRKQDHITFVLKRLQWLPVRQRVIHNTPMINYKSLNIG